MASKPTPAPSAVRRRHWEMLVVAVVVMILSFVLRVRADGRVAVHSLDRYPMPPTCLSDELFDLKCPGCGLTRSFVRLAAGDWAGSLAMHPVGWLLALAVVLQLPYRIAALAGPDPMPLGVRIPRLFGWVLIASLVGVWLVRLATGSL